MLGKPRNFVMDHAYWGRGYSEGEIKSALEARGVGYEYIGNEDKLAEVCAAELASGRVLGWYQGRFEWGPRALGNRSIIADPRRESMKDVVNTKIKFREPFRPFAPSILSERVGDYFDGTADSANLAEGAGEVHAGRHAGRGKTSRVWSRPSATSAPAACRPSTRSRTRATMP